MGYKKILETVSKNLSQALLSLLSDSAEVVWENPHKKVEHPAVWHREQIVLQITATVA